MTSKQRRARMIAMAAQEESDPSNFGWYYFSFANEDGFLGAAVVQAHGIITGIQRTHDLGINPGGEVRCVAIPKESLHYYPEDCRNKLLTKEEVLGKLQGRKWDF